MLKKGSYKSISGALEGAFAVVVAQNAILLSKPIGFIIINDVDLFQVSILLFSFLNFLAITSNWVSCVVYSDDTSNASFFLDVITLGFFGITTEVITSLYKSNSLGLSTLLLVASIMYAAIHLLFIAWNIQILTKETKQKTVFSTVNLLNFIAFIICIAISSTSSYKILSFVLFLIFFGYWIYLIFFFFKSIHKDEQVV